MQIMREMQTALNTKDVLIYIKDKSKLCVSSRGIKDKSSFTTTIEYDGKFNDEAIRAEFFNCIEKKV